MVLRRRVSTTPYEVLAFVFSFSGQGLCYRFDIISIPSEQRDRIFVRKVAEDDPHPGFVGTVGEVIFPVFGL